MLRKLLFFLTTVFILVFAANKQVKYFINVERPVIEYVNHDYIANLTVSSRRLSRKSQIHYFNLDVYTTQVGDNNFLVEFFFYQFTSNRYQPSFVEFHIKLCDLITKNEIFGYTVRRSGLDKCPIPPGHYPLTKLMVAPMAIPKSFPFNKGRIYANVSYIPKKESVARVHGDMELKELKEDF